MTLVAAPSPAQVAAFLGRVLDPEEDPDDAAALQAVIDVTVTAARSHTRGVGFTDDGKMRDDIAAAVLTAAARTYNSSPGILREEIGNYSVLYEAGATNWTVRETVCLNSYRRTAT